MKPDHVSPLDKLNFFSNDIDWDSLKKNLDIDWNLLLRDHPPDRKLEIITEKIYEVCSAHIPERKSLDRSGKPKIPRDRRILMRKRKRANDKLKLSLSESRRKKFERQLVNIELLLQKSHNDSRSFREEKALDAIKKNPKYFFSYAKKFSKLSSKIGPLLDENNSYTGSSKKMADLLSTQYTSVFSKPLTTSPYANCEKITTSTLDDIEFSKEDIEDAIDELANTSGSGPDGIPAMLLKKCKCQLSSALYILWRDCLDCGITPDKLKAAHIIPIFKSGHQGLPSNYRPIALTSHLIKIFEKVLRNGMVKFFDDNNLFNNTQHGFRQSRSCLSQLLDQFEKVLRRLEENVNVDVIYLDFAKAFDKVDHNVLLDKLVMMGIEGKILKWITSFLRDRTQEVMVNGFLSNPAKVLSGVPQGSVLGPLLFLVMISDIDRDVLHSFLSSFADDTRIGRSIKSVEDALELQKDLDRIYQWAKDNNMDFNNNKFELIRYGLNQIIKDATSYSAPDGSHIPEKTHVKDLGVTMSNNVTFSEHINKICQKARDMCSWILRTFKARTPILMLTLWRSLVQPILDYCSQLWCPISIGQIKQIEEIQKAFTRKIRSGQSENYWLRLKTYRLYSQERRRERYRILYLWKIREKIVPPVGEGNSGLFKLHARNGQTCDIPLAGRNTPRQIQKARDSSILVHGGKLFNCLPKSLRNCTECSLPEFKSKLDGFLALVPDEPIVQGYTQSHSAYSNSLIKLVPLLCKDL